MKKCLSIFIVLFILIANILILTSCTETPSENETEITVFAASSMTETLTEIAQIYETIGDYETAMTNLIEGEGI